MVCLAYYCFTDHTLDADKKSMMGWVVIVIILFNLSFNYLVLIVTTIKGLIKYFKRRKFLKKKALILR